MDKNRELERFNFMLQRDGEAAAIDFAKRTIAVYRASCKNGRKKQGKHFAYRREFLESIYSFRYILKEMQ
jgi:hypothetical protein